MNSLQETTRQIKIALFATFILVSIGVAGFMILEGLRLVDAIYLTVITLTTVGYGDFSAKSDLGKFFTMGLLLTGFGIVAFGIQATVNFIISPEVRDLRRKQQLQRIISKLSGHYVLCGSSTLVNQTVQYTLDSVQKSMEFDEWEFYKPIDQVLDRWFGDDALGHHPRIRGVFRRLFLITTRPFRKVQTLLDKVVVVTDKEDFARQLRQRGLLVVEGDPTSEDSMYTAGVQKATTCLIMLDNDTDALLAVLTARTLNEEVYIIAALIGDDLVEKTAKAGANNVLRPYHTAGQFMNNLTLRPVVYDFFYNMLFDQSVEIQVQQFLLDETNSLVGKEIGELSIRKSHEAIIIAIFTPQGEWIVAPTEHFMLRADHEVLIVVPGPRLPSLIRSYNLKQKVDPAKHQNLAMQAPVGAAKVYTEMEAEEAITLMDKHFILAGNDQIISNAIEHLDPSRPFVVLSPVHEYVQQWRDRGFKVITGSPIHEGDLHKVGVERALAIMVSLDNEAENILAVINSRSISDNVLITSVVNNQSRRNKLMVAGADRVINPISIASQVVLHTATAPTVSAFFRHILYNVIDGLETTELYMQDNSPWIGKSIESLRLDVTYQAKVLGVKQKDGQFIYGPESSYEVSESDVLIILTPMMYGDELRNQAHGGTLKRPHSLRFLPKN